ncbi:putative Peptidyl-prolyl cis-trans isomerase 4 [Blattamonas nauphoetae]|uniref:RING-type E3 ubiquitin transferase n=1 Tax=Blattamonas nauphoetae TaxID=2049346 RepID=A0ABQ9X564_9EUKA|nr:putative Peptidyl-prolyl cis-trans isomerase 4 [Blattamonas nauphoetae]
MGKSKNTKNYIKASEWKESFGGKKARPEAIHLILPFDHCCLSLQPFTNPVCTPEGHVFDFVNILEWMKDHHNNPVTGEPLTRDKLVQLHYTKNSSGEYVDPVTSKVFTNHTRIVALKVSGEVFAYETIKELAIDTKELICPVTGKPFTMRDLITLQNPNDPDFQNVHSFYHYHKGNEEEKVAPSVSESSFLKKVMHTVQKNDEIAEKQRQISEREREEALAKERKDQEDIIFVNKDNFLQTMSTVASHQAASFTSTGITFDTERHRRELETKRRRVVRITEKAYVMLETNLGNLNIELHCDLVPKTCDNFLQLAERGYYNGTIFHRLIKGFMIQGGDPTGTGRGGESAFGKPFEDEFYPNLSHNKRGILSMANSGPMTNGSQFFITFAPCTHLDRLHSVFGHVVGKVDTLKLMEAVPVNKSENPVNQIVIQNVTVFNNPFSVEREKNRQRLLEEKTEQEGEKRAKSD